MHKLNELPKYPKNVDSTMWRGFCMGYNEKGEPVGSDSTWSKYRSQCGITGRQNLSAYQSYLLLIRSRLSFVCKELNIARPKDKDIDVLFLEKIADLWIQISGDDWRENLLRLAHKKGLPISEVKKLIEEWVGKPLSERTIRRKFARAGIPYRRNQRLSNNRIKRLYRVLMTKSVI